MVLGYKGSEGFVAHHRAIRVFRYDLAVGMRQ